VATITERRLKNGGKAFLVQIRRKGQKTQSRTFDRRSDAVVYR
jgi:hypothetical protein